MKIQQVRVGCEHCTHETHAHHVPVRTIYPHLCTTNGLGVPVCSDCTDCTNGL